MQTTTTDRSAPLSSDAETAHIVASAEFDREYLRVNADGKLTLAGLQPGEVYLVQVARYDELLGAGHG